MVWRVTNEPVDCRPSRGTNKHTQDRKRCSLLDDNSTATADYDTISFPEPAILLSRNQRLWDNPSHNRI